MKVIPKVKKDFKIISWRGVSEKFKSLLELKMRLFSTLTDHLPPESEVYSFEVGYLEGRKQTKRWIISDKDITEMYENEDEEILLWCDGKDVTRKRKHPDDASPESAVTSKRSNGSHESHIEDLTQELSSIHGDKFNYAQYKLWARMIVNKQHINKDVPPNIPMIVGKIEKKSKRDFSETISDCAVAIVKALAPTSIQPQPTTSQALSISEGISPGKKVNLRAQYLSQLKTLQNLRDDGVLTQEEFQQEKAVILSNLKAMK